METVKKLDMSLDFDGSDLKRLGIQKAADTAEKHINGWSETALNYLKEYCAYHTTFSGEEIREWAKSKGFDAPDEVSKRCWGGIFKRAANMGIIRKVGTHITENPLSHGCYSTLWQRSQ